MKSTVRLPLRPKGAQHLQPCAAGLSWGSCGDNLMIGQLPTQNNELSLTPTMDMSCGSSSGIRSTFGPPSPSTFFGFNVDTCVPHVHLASETWPLSGECPNCGGAYGPTRHLCDLLCECDGHLFVRHGLGEEGCGVDPAPLAWLARLLVRHISGKQDLDTAEGHFKFLLNHFSPED
jgi:hypothetical protein